MPLFRLTFKDEYGKPSEIEVRAANMLMAFQNQADISRLITIKQINRITGEAMDKIYDE
jgi:hypothetical protein